MFAWACKVFLQQFVLLFFFVSLVVPSCILSVYFLETLGSFFDQYIAFYLKKSI